MNLQSSYIKKYEDWRFFFISKGRFFLYIIPIILVKIIKIQFLYPISLIVNTITNAKGNFK